MNVSPLEVTHWYSASSQSVTEHFHSCFCPFPCHSCAVRCPFTTHPRYAYSPQLLQVPYKKGLSSRLYTFAPHMHHHTLLYINFNCPLSAAPLNQNPQAPLHLLFILRQNTASTAKSNGDCPLPILHIQSFCIYTQSSCTQHIKIHRSNILYNRMFPSCDLVLYLLFSSTILHSNEVYSITFFISNI